MKILAIEHAADGSRSLPSPSLLEEEARKVWELHSSGTIREIYFRADRREAVLILECLTVQEADHILSDLPLVKADMIRFEIIPLSAYTGFARLFTREAASDGNVG